MKYLVLSVCFLFLSIGLQAQDTSKKDISKYETAYNYLLADSATSSYTYVVSDTLIFMERSPFWKFFQREGESSVDCISRIDSIDNENRFTKEYSRELTKAFGTNVENANLYFSKVSDNVLFAEYFYRYGFKQNKLTVPAKYNAGYRYLFVFDSDNSIREVLKQMVAYK